MYLWNASTGDIQQLFQMEGPEEYAGSVAWIKEGNYLAVGGSNGDVQVGVVVFCRLDQHVQLQEFKLIDALFSLSLFTLQDLCV